MSLQFITGGESKFFQPKTLAKAWDGRFKGEKVNSGTFIYIIKGSGEKGNIFLKGNFF